MVVECRVHVLTPLLTPCHCISAIGNVAYHLSLKVRAHLVSLKVICFGEKVSLWQLAMNVSEKQFAKVELAVQGNRLLDICFLSQWFFRKVTNILTETLLLVS